MVARSFSGENVAGVKDVVLGVVGIPEGVSGVHRPSCNGKTSEAVVGAADWSVSMAAIKMHFVQGLGVWSLLKQYLVSQASKSSNILAQWRGG